MLSPNFFPFPQLRTDRLLLRQLTLADAPRVQRLRSDGEVMKYSNRPLTLTLEEAESWVTGVLHALAAGDGICWSICLEANPSEHVGDISIWRIEKENYRGEIGYMLEPSLQGKGLMSEALQKVVEYAFTELKLHSIEARIDPRNLASAALLQKTGFVQEAYFRENYYLHGSFADTAVYSLLTPHRAEAVYEGQARKNSVVY